MANTPSSIKFFVAAIAELEHSLNPSLQKEVNDIGSLLENDPRLAQNEIVKIAEKNPILNQHFKAASKAHASWYSAQPKDKVINPPDEVEQPSPYEERFISNVSLDTSKENQGQVAITSILLSKNSVKHAKQVRKSLISKEELNENNYIWVFKYLK